MSTGPRSLEATIRRAWARTGGRTPILVTENGLATADDAERIRYVDEALHGVHACLADGIDVRGYTYWSLLDNFEWTYGYVPKFGIVEVDRNDLRASAQIVGPLVGRCHPAQRHR